MRAQQQINLVICERNPAHLLDDEVIGPQVCEIEIQFEAFDKNGKEHFFSFNRRTEGEHKENLPPVNEQIIKLEDTLEIDRGKNIIRGDRVYEIMASEFRFNECAEYFCFDGEKAREVMQIASDTKNIRVLLDLVNRRTTHPKLKEYKKSLDGLRQKVLEEARAKITDNALRLISSRLENKREALKTAAEDLEKCQIRRDTYEIARSKQDEIHEELIHRITNSEINAVMEMNKYELELKTVINNIEIERNSIYENWQRWISDLNSDGINEIKTMVREKGKLPEPYRSDLITRCLEKDRCEICGNDLNENSRNRIKNLLVQVAPHDVQVFLSSDFSSKLTPFGIENKYDSIVKLIERKDSIENKMKLITLTKEDQQLVVERENARKQLKQMDDRLAELDRTTKDMIEYKRSLQIEIKDLEGKIGILKENKIILDKIDESIEIINAAAEAIKEKATDIISDVISEGVSSILGDNFSAKFSRSEGLMLGENGYFGKEKGGYSGRLILSYCFAEAMTVVDPIIVDTPAGNIGEPRERLAKHLVANHKQVVLLCLPTEIQNFGPIVSVKDPEIIHNLR